MSRTTRIRHGPRAFSRTIRSEINLGVNVRALRARSGRSAAVFRARADVCARLHAPRRGMRGDATWCRCRVRCRHADPVGPTPSRASPRDGAAPRCEAARETMCLESIGCSRGVSPARDATRTGARAAARSAMAPLASTRPSPRTGVELLPKPALVRGDGLRRRA